MIKAKTMKTIVRNQAGVTSIEFAMISLPMFMILMGSLEFGIQMYQKTRAETVLREAARMAVTGDVTITGTDGEKIDNYVRSSLMFTKDTKVDITKKFYDRFGDVGQPEKKLDNRVDAPYCFIDINENQKWDLDPSRKGLGGADDIIQYRVDVTYKPMFPLVSNMVTNGEPLHVNAQTTIKNEPFAGNINAQPQTCCVSASPGNPVTCE